jgi:Ni/Co efflux regulator RcnB
MGNEFENTKGKIMEGFDGVIKDSEAIRDMLSHPEKLSSADLEFVKARIGNNKAINVALNGEISIIRLTNQTEKE